MFVQDALALGFHGDRDLVDNAPSTPLPDPAPWVRGVAQALIEVMAGIRPPASVVRLTTPPVYVAVARRYGATVRRAATRSPAGTGPAVATPTGRGSRRLAVLRIHCSCTRADTAEVAVVLVDGSRVRAMALELTALAGGWRVSALEIA
ncbi:MAG: Rv3235 family protein [Tetrasphaera sp.]